MDFVERVVNQRIDQERLFTRVHGRPRLPTGASSELRARLDHCLAGWKPPQ